MRGQQHLRRSRVSRVARFISMRDVFMSRLGGAPLVGPQGLKCTIGPFLIRYDTVAQHRERWHNIQIWPPGEYDHYFGTYVQGNKVANANWDDFDNVDLITFRGGRWDEHLLMLLMRGEDLLVVDRGESPIMIK